MDRRTFIKAAGVAAMLPLIPGQSRKDCPVEVFVSFEEQLAKWERKRLSELKKGDLFKLFNDSGRYLVQRDVGRADEIAFATADARLVKNQWAVRCVPTEDKLTDTHGQVVWVRRLGGCLRACVPWPQEQPGWHIVNIKAIRKLNLYT